MAKIHLSRSRVLIISLFAILVVGGLVGSLVYKSFFSRNISIPEGEKAYIYIDEAKDIDSVYNQLARHNWCDNLPALKRYVSTSKSFTLRTGRYEIKDGMTNRNLIHHLMSGGQVPIKLTFNNIRLNSNLAARLGERLMIDSLEVAQALNDPEFLKAYGMNPQTVLAMFIPNTYEIYWDISVRKLFDRMFKEYSAFWTDVRLAKAAAIPLTPIEVATLASIVDEETNKKFEKPVIAGLYINRLRIGMPLQACPTAKFAVGDFSLTQILIKHTQVESPYNTYKYKGLPPGPIRMPSIIALDAVLNYDKNNYIYMCAKETLNGEHNFAANLAQHNRNAQKYNKAYREWRRNRKN